MVVVVVDDAATYVFGFFVALMYPTKTRANVVFEQTATGLDYHLKIVCSLRLIVHLAQRLTKSVAEAI